MKRLREVSQEMRDRVDQELPRKRHEFHLWWLQRYTIDQIRRIGGNIDTPSDRARSARHAPQHRTTRKQPTKP